MAVTIEPETLGEYIVAIDTVPREGENATGTEYVSRKPEYFQYVYYNNQKYYLDTKYNDEGNTDNPSRTSSTYVTIENEDSENTGEGTESEEGINLFRLNNNLRVYLNENEANGLAAEYLGLEDYTEIDESTFIDKSAVNYYNKALEFSNDFIELFQGQSNLQIVTKSFNDQLSYTSVNTETGEEMPLHARYDLRRQYLRGI